jgi:hypothetical protein
MPRAAARRCPRCAFGALPLETRPRLALCEATADTWLIENDPEGLAFEYEVLEQAS